MADRDLARPSDRARLKATVVAHYDFVWRILRRFGLSGDEADDASQEVFAVLAAKIADVHAGAEKSYLFQTARLLAGSQRRRRARLPVPTEDEALEAHPDPWPTPESLADSSERFRLLDSLLDRLPEDLRDAFILCEIENVTRAEAAVILGVPAGTVSSRIRLAHERLLKWMPKRNEP